MGFINALFTAMLDNNLVFCQVVSMVTVILAAARPQDAVKFGAMLAAALTVTGFVSVAVYGGYLLPWGVSYLAPIVFALVDAVLVYVGATIASFGKPAAERARAMRLAALVAVNSAVMAVVLGNGLAAAAGTATADVQMGTACGAGLGVMLSVVLFAYVRDAIDERLVPHALRGLPISLITASLMALAFTGVSGIAGGLFV